MTSSGIFTPPGEVGNSPRLTCWMQPECWTDGICSAFFPSRDVLSPALRGVQAGSASPQTEFPSVGWLTSFSGIRRVAPLFVSWEWLVASSLPFADPPALAPTQLAAWGQR